MLLDEDAASDGSSSGGDWQRVRSGSALPGPAMAGWRRAAGGGGGGGAPRSLGASRWEREIAASEVMLRSLRMIENMSGLEADGGGSGVP